MGGGAVAVRDGLFYDAESHRYFIDGSPAVGLTNAIKLTGFVDDSWFTDEASERGTRVHAACQFLAEDDLGTVAEDDKPRVDAFARFLSEYTPTLVMAEAFCFSRTYRFACRLDFIFDVKALGGLSIIEVKTGRPGLAAKLQTAGQEVAARETFRFGPLKRFGFELTKEGRYKLVPHTDTADRPMILNAVGMVNRRLNAGELKL